MFYYDPAEPAVVPRGSLILCHSPDFIGKMIRMGEWLRWRKGCNWNHCAIAVETGTNPLVIQATVKGVTGNQRLKELEGGPIAIVPPPSTLKPSLIVKFATQELHDGYGYLTLFGAAIDQLLPRWFRFQIGRDGSWICSALAAESWRAGGWVVKWPNIYAVSPAQVAIAVGIDPSEIFKTQQKGRHGRTNPQTPCCRRGASCRNCR